MADKPPFVIKAKIIEPPTYNAYTHPSVADTIVAGTILFRGLRRDDLKGADSVRINLSDKGAALKDCPVHTGAIEIHTLKESPGGMTASIAGSQPALAKAQKAGCFVTPVRTTPRGSASGN